MSIAISLNKLKYIDVNPSITKAIYVDGPDRFDEWLVLVKHIFPNIRKVICRDSGLESLVCNGIKSLDCSNNKLTLLVSDATKIKCSNNYLTRLNAPKSTIIIANNNQLKHLNCPNVAYLECNNNSLEVINCPEVICFLAYNNLFSSLYLPKAKVVEFHRMELHSEKYYYPRAKIISIRGETAL
jgi:Leucine-rich repeat (LRR) protein